MLCAGLRLLEESDLRAALPGLAMPSLWLAGRRDRREVRFLRPDGRVANAARTKVAKGRLAGWLLAHAAPDVTSAEVADAADPGEGWSLAADGVGLVATDHR